MMAIITAKDNQYLKLARGLNKKKIRKEQGLFLAEGLRLCREALLAGLLPRFVLLSDAVSAPVREVAEEAGNLGAPVFIVSRALLEAVSATEHSQGIIFVLPQMPPLPLPSGGHCYAYCDGIADPGNMGAIFRSAYAAGVSGLILSPDSADPYNPKVVRSAMGALFRLAFCRAADDEQAREMVKTLNLPVYATAMAGQDIRQMGEALRQPHIWVLGSEAKGVSAQWLQTADKCVSLPMQKGAESLNVAVTAGILFYQSFFAK